MIAAIFGLILLLTLVALHYQNEAKITRIQRQGLHQIIKLKQLINLVQQHRGLSSAWLNGDSSKQANLTQIKKQITLIQSGLNKNISSDIESRWNAFEDHWQRLQETQNKSSAIDNFQQHTKLVANLMYLLEDIAEFSDLNCNQLKSLPGIGLVWRELVVVTENIGQSRAIGTGAATRKSCGQVDKIRLAYLQQNIAAASEQIIEQLPRIDNNAQAYQQLTKAAKEKVNALSNTISSELLNAKKIKIDQSEYFEMATSAIESLNQIFDYQINQVKTKLKLA